MLAGCRRRGVRDRASMPLVSSRSRTSRSTWRQRRSTGLKPGDVRRDATTLTSGLIVGSLYEQAKIFDVVVWGAPVRRGSSLTEPAGTC